MKRSDKLKEHSIQVKALSNLSTIDTSSHFPLVPCGGGQGAALSDCSYWGGSQVYDIFSRSQLDYPLYTFLVD